MAEVFPAAPPTTSLQDGGRCLPAIRDKQQELLEVCCIEREFGLRAGEVGSEPWELDCFTFPAQMLHCHEARLRVDRLADSAGMTDEARADVMLAVGEAVANAVEHGNGGDTNGSFTVRCVATPSRVLVSVSDRGPGFRLDDLPTIEDSLASEHGRGIHCMNAVMDQVSFDFASGTTVRMIKLG